MKKIIIVIVALVYSVTFSVAQIPDRPNPPKLVNDFAKILNANELGQLESSLEQFARETSTQLVIVTVADLEGQDKSDFAFQIGEKWGVGQKGKDNGIVILLKPKTTNSRGEVFIATGYGLEGVLPDAIVNTAVVNNEMMPHFKLNDYYGGLVGGTKVIMEIARGEYTADQYQKSAQSGGGSIVFIVIVFVVIMSIFGRGRRGRMYSPGKSLPFWLAMGMMSGGGRSSGSFSNFSSGGGGFGGFGGGSFGGGGAGGSW